MDNNNNEHLDEGKNLNPNDGLKEIMDIKSKSKSKIINSTQEESTNDIATKETVVIQKEDKENSTPIKTEPETHKEITIEKDILGVKVLAPLYMIVTPCTHIEFSIQSMTVMMEEALKTSLTSKQSLIKMLATAIYQCIVIKPNDINDFDDFAKTITAADQVALFFGLLHQSYGEISDISTECPKCDEPMDIDNISTGSLMDLKPYQGNDFLTKEIKFTTEHGFVISMKQPTLYEELDLFDRLLELPNDKIGELKDYLANVNYIIHPDGKKLTSITDKFMVISELNLREGKQLMKKFHDAYGEFGCTFMHKTKCKMKTCGFNFSVEVDLFQQFFRMVR